VEGEIVRTTEHSKVSDAFAVALVVGLSAQPATVTAYAGTCEHMPPVTTVAREFAFPAMSGTFHCTTALLHESYYNFPLPDLITRGRLFRAHAVPVLQELVEAGSVHGWYVAEMPIGSSSNLYLGVVLRDSVALAEFQEHLLPRVAQRAGIAWDMLARWMTPEREELWEIVSIRLPSRAVDGMWLQHRVFEVSTAQADGWRAFSDERTTPVRERSMDAGVLDGWIELRRLDGDRHSWKFLEWYGDWEEIYEFNQSLFAELGAADLQRAIAWARATERMRREIWRYLPRNSQPLPAERGSGAGAGTTNRASPGPQQ
jgi:hypothetical protein